jgi:hypothetical protein
MMRVMLVTDRNLGLRCMENVVIGIFICCNHVAIH